MFGPDAPLNPNGDPHPTSAKFMREQQKEIRTLREKLRRAGLNPYASDE
jgi:hypothetical protein